jgi:arsenate reductase (thioredoxin)
MREIGFDIAGRRPKKLDREMQLHADWAITLHCKAACLYVAAAVEDWGVDDPAGQPLEEVRRIRDELEERVREFVETPLDERGARALIRPHSCPPADPRLPS